MKIRENPRILDSKKKLVSLWQLALSERNQNKKIQERVATEVARHTGVVEFEHTEEDAYQAMVLQFLWMDHMDQSHPDQDEEWDRLADMLHKLPEYKN